MHLICFWCQHRVLRYQRLKNEPDVEFAKMKNSQVEIYDKMSEHVIISTDLKSCWENFAAFERVEIDKNLPI